MQPSAYETIEIVIAGAVQEIQAEITEDRAVILSEGHDISELLNEELRGEVEALWQEHEQHLRDEAHYQRELKNTDEGVAYGERWR